MSNVISEKRQKSTLRGKKAKKSTVKNVLTSPYTHYWPLLKKEDDVNLKAILKSNLATIRKTKPNIPWEEIKQIPKEQRRAYRARLSEIDHSGARNITSKSIYLGINEVTKIIEKDEAISVLLANDVEPHLMIKHIIDLCILKLVPILVVSNFKEFLKQVLGISAAAIAFAKDVVDNEKNETIIQAINRIFLSYPIPTGHACFNNENLNFLTTSHTNEHNIHTKQDLNVDVYLYRDDKSSGRVFIPRSSNDTHNEKCVVSMMIKVVVGYLFREVRMIPITRNAEWIEWKLICLDF
ncbi:Ribosomal protein L7Ae/L30e/S12e/Gadd45 family [Popillia japonica]|uniref:Ribosomal protein L7Ae/L30e/S12e/Gadd45 family n=1 Tax=Popillia japonica TaxID=7064 RepID=A0AAW1N2D9_POPJA